MPETHFGFKLHELLIFGWLVVLYALLTPLLIFSLHRYRQVSYLPFIYHRRPKLVMACCILTILYSSVYSPSLLIISAFYYDLSQDTVTNFLLNTLPLVFISLHFSIRFYQCYYDLNYNSSMADHIWSQAINPKTDNFYLRNRQRFGNVRFQYIVFSIFMVISNGIIIGIVLYFGSVYIYIAQAIVVFVLILYIVPLFIILTKLTTFLDHIKIRIELLWNLILSLIVITVISTHSLLCIFVDHAKYMRLYGVLSVIVSVIFFCICYIQTLYIILQREAQIHLVPGIHKYSVTGTTTPRTPGSPTPNTPKSTKTIDAAISTPDIASRMNEYSRSSSWHDPHKAHNHHKKRIGMGLNTIRLNHIFRNDDTFKLFIRHIAKEYCIENALFLFESQQFKKQCGSVEAQLSGVGNTNMMISQRSTESTGSTTRSSVHSKQSMYSKQRRNLLLTVPTTVPEDEHKEVNDGGSSPTPVSKSESDEVRFPETGIEVKPKATKKRIIHHYATGSNHYSGDNKILDFIPFHLIPQSELIEKYQNDFEKIFIKLYDKYIDWKRSSFEINISGANRNKLHSIYVRVTYQLLMEERHQILKEQASAARVDSGSKEPKEAKENKPRSTKMWQSRRSIVNALKATITKQQMDDTKDAGDDEDAHSEVEIQEMVDVLTLAEQDIIRNLNDSLTRFRQSLEFTNWFQANINGLQIPS
eukprot:241619_1